MTLSADISTVRAVIARLLAPTRLSPLAWTVAAVAAIAVGVGGYFHGHLFHEGYSQVKWVGPLFLINTVASAIDLALLVLRRTLLFVLGALSISVGSIVSILISHSSSFLGFAEDHFDGRAQIIVIAEIVATVLTVLLVVIARSDLLPREDSV